MRRKLSGTGTMSSVAGTGVAGYSGDGGLATLARLNITAGVAVDASGNIYVSDSWFSVIRMVTKSTGIITTIAGTVYNHGYAGDGGLATSASLYGPQGLALDTSGNIYVADARNNRIRKITKSTGIITTVAGTGTAGYSGNGGPAIAATLRYPIGVAVDSLGNIFVADFFNYAIRKITKSTGIITTVAGTGLKGYSGDEGHATLASLGRPVDVAIYLSSYMFISDPDNGAIRVITLSTGNITSATIVGHPAAVISDSSGNIFILDNYNGTIYMINSTLNSFSIVAGTGVRGYSGDGGLATLSDLNRPFKMAVDNSDTVYYTDSGSHRVRSFSVPTTTTTSSAIPNYMSVGLYNPVWWISASLLLLMW